MTSTEILTYTLAVLSIVAQVISLGLIIGLVTGKLQTYLKTKKIPYHFYLISTYLISLIATLGSLYYSDVAGYTPCKLCWYQRILMYPQTILYLVALIKKDKTISIYGLVLSIVGGLLALYHYLLQIDVIHSTSCSTIGFSISCSERFSTTFGYITIPMMAFSAFALIATIWATQIITSNQKK